MKTEQNMITIPDFLIALRAIHTNIKDMTTTDLHLVTKISYGHTYKIRKLLEHKGWITIRQYEKKKFLIVTEKGERLLEVLELLLQHLEISPDKINEYRQLMKREGKEDDNYNEGIQLGDEPPTGGSSRFM